MAAGEYHEALWQALPAGLGPADLDLRLAFLLERVEQGARVLDVGCAEGVFTAALARAGADAVGIDVAAEPLRRARERHPELELARIAPDGRWPVADSSFEVVWAGEVIEHVADTAGWLSEARRALRPGGRLVLSTPAHGRLMRVRWALSRSAFERHFDPLADHLRFYTPRSLRALLQSFGFEQITVERAGGWPGARRVLLCDALRARW